MTEINNMSEYIEQIKKVIDSSSTFFVAQDQNGAGIILTKENLSSLLTTIESLQSELKEESENRRECERASLMWKRHSEDQELLVIKRESVIESQKEEIEKAIAEAKHQVELTLEFNQMYTDISLKLTDKNAEIESLKAITELAVKGLEQIRSLNYHGIEPQDDIETLAKSILSEIQRLSQ